MRQAADAGARLPFKTPVRLGNLLRRQADHDVESCSPRRLPAGPGDTTQQDASYPCPMLQRAGPQSNSQIHEVGESLITFLTAGQGAV